MPSYSGRYRNADSNGEVLGEGSCHLSIEGGNLRLVPSSGPPLACDLGDIDVFAPGEYEISLKLYSGNTILLSKFARDFQNLGHDLLGAYRDRLVQCLLLEDLEEIERFDGWAQLDGSGSGFSSRVEVRLYRSNLAVLPEAATGFSWRYAEIDRLDFDDSSYTVVIHSDNCVLKLTRLAKRTGELIQRLRDGIAAVSETGARVMHSFFPFLTPDQFMRAAGAFREGKAVSVRDLNAIHPRMGAALLDAAVDESLKEYLDSLKNLCWSNGYYAGFKEIRGEAGESEYGDSETDGRDESAESVEARSMSESVQVEPEAAEDRILYWFFFPLKSAADPAIPGNAVAWEAASPAGRATYFFRLLLPGEESVLKDRDRAQKATASAVHRLNRAIVTLNFRREPIYLSEESLQTQENYRRYAIACRKIPVLRELRASFLGRAFHTSHQAWRKQVNTILAGVI